MSLLNAFKAPDAATLARAAMFTRQRPAGCSCIPTTRKLSADMEVRLTGWVNTVGCFTWAIDETETKVICRFFPTLTPNEVHRMHTMGGITGGKFEDIQLESNWGGRALLALSDWMKENGQSVSPVMQEFMAI